MSGVPMGYVFGWVLSGAMFLIGLVLVWIYKPTRDLAVSNRDNITKLYASKANDSRMNALTESTQLQIRALAQSCSDRAQGLELRAVRTETRLETFIDNQNTISQQLTSIGGALHEVKSTQATLAESVRNLGQTVEKLSQEA